MMAEQHSGARARIMSLFVSSARLDANTAKMAVFHVRLRSLNKVTVPVRRVHVSGELLVLAAAHHARVAEARGLGSEQRGGLIGT